MIIIKKKIAFFDAKSYDIASFDDANKDYEIKYFESKLNINTVVLAKGMDAVCVFVNDEITSEVCYRCNSKGKECFEKRNKRCW